MPLSTILFLAWILLVSAFVRGWTATHPLLPLIVFIVGIAYVALRLLEYLGVITYSIPTRRRTVVPADRADV